MGIRERLINQLSQTNSQSSLVTAQAQLSYTELGVLTARYQAAMPAAGEPVAIIGRRKVEEVALMLAACLSGCPFVFVEEETPLDRILTMLEILSISVVLGHGRMDSPLNAYDVSRLDAGPDRMLECVPVKANSIFYFVFTSGSTGQPKACPVRYENFEAFIEGCCALLPFVRTEAHISLSSFGFDMSMLDLWLTLVTGKTLVVAPDGFAHMPRNAVRLFSEATYHGSACLVATPTVVSLLMKDRWFCAQRLPQIAFFLIGGEAPTPAFIHEVLQRFPASRVFNGYGPSEATCMTHMTEVTQSAKSELVNRLDVGTPFGHNRADVLDPDGRPTPSGNTGEVVLSGPQVIKGYVPDDHPENASFRMINGKRCYFTGDFGQLDERGTLKVLGRKDQQVKWRGVRIEPGELEAIVEGVDGVDQAVVVPEYVQSKVVDLWLFYKAVLPSKAVTKRIRTKLAKCCRRDMRPRRIVCLTELPLTPNGKVDRKKLGLNPSEWLSPANDRPPSH